MKKRGSPKARLGGVILAGGASRRMSGQRKALLELNGRPLIDLVIQRMRPQVTSLVLSVARQDAIWDQFGLQQVADERSNQSQSSNEPADTAGPLTGLLSAMQGLHDRHEWILIAPCDAPFVPLDLGHQLLQKAKAEGANACLAVYEGVWQPTFSLWHRDLLPKLQQAVRIEGLGGFKQFLRHVEFAEQHWGSAEIPPFFNINTPKDLSAAQALFKLQTAQD